MQTPVVTDDVIARIPKSDLHVHLDGSLRPDTLIDLARQQKVRLPSYDADGLRVTVFKDSYANLAEYLRGFACTCSVLQTTEALERVARELAEDNIAEGVRYLEVRFAPQLHVQNSRDVRGVIAAVACGLTAAGKHHNATPAVRDGHDLPFVSGIIVCAMRTFNRHMGRYFEKLTSVLPGAPPKELVALASHEVARMAVAARDEDGLPVVGFDLAGEEAGYPANYHREAYQFAHRHFLRKTVHAGEAYGPESIFQAITDCHANRIGHGTFLFAADRVQHAAVADPAHFVNALAEYVASQRITVEVCLTSNLQTVPDLPDIAAHPVARMLAHNLSVSICTDNRLISHTTLSRELGLLVRHVPMTPHQLHNVVIAGFKGGFFPGSYNEKRAFVRQVENRYDAITGGKKG